MHNLINQKFNRLTVLKRIDNDKNGNLYFLCKCDCGKEKRIQYSHLQSGETQSCGCLNKEIITKHGYAKSKIYMIWKSIIQRCTNPNHKFYHNYGGRGITVCKRWMKFINFLEDMGNVPPGHQIDRIDNDKGYYKSNCRWITSKINNRNRRNNHLETHEGKTQCLIEWAEEINIHKATLWSRMHTGWSIEKTLTTPVRKYKKGKENVRRKI